MSNSGLDTPDGLRRFKKLVKRFVELMRVCVVLLLSAAGCAMQSNEPESGLRMGWSELNEMFFQR